MTDFKELIIPPILSPNSESAVFSSFSSCSVVFVVISNEPLNANNNDDNQLKINCLISTEPLNADNCSIKYLKKDNILLKSPINEKNPL